MKTHEIVLEINRKKIRITHPDKILYPETGYTKMDIIKYYLSVEKELMFLNKGRPLVFIRYPHGAGQYSFFQKNVPDNHPDWMQTVEMGLHKTANYLILNDIADLIWFIQLHALEFHIMNTRKPAFDKPDCMVFDIDPPKNTRFPEIRDFVLEIAPVIEQNGYKTFFKTSGKRGIHIVCPIKPNYDLNRVYKAAEELARQIIRKFPDTATLETRKIKRGNKFLIDIYRNRPFQTFSMPLGTRSTPPASISMPLSRDELSQTVDPFTFNISTVPEILKNKKAAWSDIFDRAAELHI